MSVSESNVSSVVSRIAAKKEEWASLSPQKKLEILDILMDNLNANCEELQDASICKRDGAKKPSSSSSYASLGPQNLAVLQNASSAAHWLHSAMLISNWLGIIREYFDSIVKTGAPPQPLQIREAPTPKGEPQRYIVKVGPKGLLHTTLVTCGSMELLVEGPVEQEMIHQRPAGLTAVLGAGNFDGPVDLLTSLFIENKVCVYKVSPFNSLLLEPLNKIFSPLIENNYAAFICGGVEEGTALLHHPEVDKWYMTGDSCCNDIQRRAHMRPSSSHRHLQKLGSEETFSPCCGEVPLDTESTIEAFLPAAVEYTNEKVHGGLSVSISVKPSSAAQEQVVEEAISNLKYGAVHINTDTKLSIAFPSLVWGGCPGSTIYELNSGIGFIGNCFGLKRPLKSVIRAPFLNFTQMILAAPNSSNAAKMAKLWRRIAYATFQRRSTQGWLSFAGSLTKIASAFAANL